MTATAHPSVDTRVPGIVLIAASVAMIAAMAHHPTPSGADFTAWATNVARMGPLNEAVHGVLLVLLGLLTWALTTFAIGRGLHRSWVTLGLVAWMIGMGSMMIAGVLNSFVVTDIARRAVANPENADMIRTTLQVMLAGSRIVAIIGVVGMSTAVFFWSADLTGGAAGTRWTGLLGLTAGLATVLALATGLVRLNVGGLMLILVVWATWFVAIGALMIRRKV